MEEAYQQIAHYHDILYDNNVGIMMHILLGDPGVQDYGHWCTGNGWAVNGMLRVLRIIQLSRFAPTMGSEQANLIRWSSTVSLIAFSRPAKVVSDDWVIRSCRMRGIISNQAALS